MKALARNHRYLQIFTGFLFLNSSCAKSISIITIPYSRKIFLCHFLVCGVECQVHSAWFQESVTSVSSPPYPDKASADEIEFLGVSNRKELHFIFPSLLALEKPTSSSFLSYKRQAWSMEKMGEQVGIFKMLAC